MEMNNKTSNIILVLNSSTSVSPYINYYRKLLDENQIYYKVVVWDRLNTEILSPEKIVFKDKKISQSRGFLDHLKFAVFAKKHIKKDDKLIVFDIPNAYFLSLLLFNKNQKMILDIRDHHKILNKININKLISKFGRVVISSPGFKKFLPKDREYLYSHNVEISKLYENNNRSSKIKKDTYTIGFTGILRDYEVNQNLVLHLGKSSHFQVNYYGIGTDLLKLEDYVQNKGLSNVHFYGKYDNKDIESIYNRIDLTNILLGTDFNSNILLPNRLYQSVIFNKPVITNKGTYTAEIVEKYNLGYIVENFHDLESQLIQFLNDMSESDFNKGKEQFIFDIEKSDKEWKENILDFLMGS